MAAQDQTAEQTHDIRPIRQDTPQTEQGKQENEAILFDNSR